MWYSLNAHLPKLCPLTLPNIKDGFSLVEKLKNLWKSSSEPLNGLKLDLVKMQELLILPEQTIFASQGLRSALLMKMSRVDHNPSLAKMRADKSTLKSDHCFYPVWYTNYNRFSCYSNLFLLNLSRHTSKFFFFRILLSWKLKNLCCFLYKA